MHLGLVNAFILVFSFGLAAEGKGLYSGVPCHLPYKCIFETNDDGYENSLLVDSADGVSEERICQDMCQARDFVRLVDS